MKKAFPIPVRVKYSCAKCPAYCCSYPEIEATPRDIQRLARRFGLGYSQAEERFTRRDPAENVRLLRHRQDRIFDSVCVLLDQETRRCTAYGDRKSTRLNSSHTVISYAVFCLKKKKKKKKKTKTEQRKQ